MNCYSRDDFARAVPLEEPATVPDWLVCSSFGSDVLFLPSGLTRHSCYLRRKRLRTAREPAAPLAHGEPKLRAPGRDD